MNVPFQLVNWDQLPETVHPGEVGESRARTLDLGGLRIRRVTYSAGYRADHWCTQGHVVQCLAGTMLLRLAGAGEQTLREGMSFVVSDELSSHWSGTDSGCVALILDGEFLRALSPSVRDGLPWCWGGTEAERLRAWPCDVLVPTAKDAFLRAVDVSAPAEAVFRWLCQLRVGPYSYDALDNRFRRSPQELTPGVEQLAPGQSFMGFFELAAYTQGRDLTLRLSDPRGKRIYGDVALTYAATPTGSDRCRLACKVVIHYAGGNARPMRWLLPWGDLLMMRRQLLNLKRLSERSSGPGAVR